MTSPVNNLAYTERHHKRWQLVSLLRVYDFGTGELIGHLFDVTSEGIRLISEQPIPIERHFHLRMDLPDPEQSSESQADKSLSCEPLSSEPLLLDARSIWSKKDINPNFWDTGFQLLEVTDETKSRIEHLINELKTSQS